MPLKQCNACKGVYADVGPDGVRYFHVCPPLVELFDADGTQLSQEAAAAARAAGERVVTVERPRPNARNENVDATKVALALARDDRKAINERDESFMVARGAGVRDVPAR